MDSHFRKLPCVYLKTTGYMAKGTKAISNYRAQSFSPGHVINLILEIHCVFVSDLVISWDIESEMKGPRIRKIACL